MKEEINVLIKEDEIVARVKELAEQINRDYEGNTSFDLHFERKCIFYLRTGKIYYSAGYD